MYFNIILLAAGNIPLFEELIDSSDMASRPDNPTRSNIETASYSGKCHSPTIKCWQDRLYHKAASKQWHDFDIYFFQTEEVK